MEENKYQPPTDLGSTLYSTARMRALADEYAGGDEEKQALIWGALTSFTFSGCKDDHERLCRVTNLKRFLADAQIKRS